MNNQLMIFRSLTPGPAGRYRVMSEETVNTTHKKCSLCGAPIPAARLEALPGVTTCIECAKKHPRKVDISGVELSQASPINRNGFAPKD
jgi:Prokaryotic dksA/traR C4-type zinc finger